MSAGKPVAKYAESIPAASAPVNLPRLVPSRARFLAGVVTGGLLLVVTVVGVIVGAVLS